MCCVHESQPGGGWQVFMMAAICVALLTALIVGLAAVVAKVSAGCGSQTALEWHWHRSEGPCC